MEDFKNILFERLWRENEPALRRICRVKMQNYPDKIDEVISDLFFALFKAFLEDEIPENPKAWLYGTLNNIIKVKYRNIYNLKEKQVSLSDEELELPFAYGGIEDKIDEIYSSEIKVKLRSWLREDEYQIIKGIHFDNLKIKEIAVLHNSTESAIKQKHYRICNKLRRKIKDSKKIF